MDELNLKVQKEHSILKFIGVLNSLGTVTVFTFLLHFFFKYIFMTFCVLIYLIDHVNICLAFDFWQVLFLAYSIQHLVFGICFWHKITHFVSVSSVTFWHLYIVPRFPPTTRELPFFARSCTCSNLRNSNPTQSKYRIACSPEYSRNLLSAQHFCLTQGSL